MALPPTRP